MDIAFSFFGSVHALPGCRVNGLVSVKMGTGRQVRRAVQTAFSDPYNAVDVKTAGDDAGDVARG
jgi:hypothetical protein